MAKLNDVRALAKETAEKVSRSPQEWTKYLDTTARLYRYPFSDSLLIHAQRPDAEACASMELWNGKMCRWIKRGAKGIALIDDRGRRKKLRYVFDISDTRLVRGGRTPFLWQIREEQREAVRSYLAESYWLEGEGTENLPAILQEIAFGLAKEELGEAMEGLKKLFEGKNRKQEKNLGQRLRNCLQTAFFMCWFGAADWNRWSIWKQVHLQELQSLENYHGYHFWEMPQINLQNRCLSVSEKKCRSFIRRKPKEG